ncbi:unnamed protein product, partial [Symbiodinium sp. CCMP2456]
DTSADMPSGSQSDPHIVLVQGKTGVGKSTLCCWLSDSFDTKVFAISHDKGAGTVEVAEPEDPVKYLGGHIHGPDFGDGSNFSETYIRIIDVPGLGGNVPGKSDGDVLRAMKVYLKEKCNKVSAIIWLEEPSVKQDSSRERMVASYVDFLGIEALKNLVVVCNKAPKTLTNKVEDDEDNEDAASNLERFKKSFKEILQDILQPVAGPSHNIADLVSLIPMVDLNLPEIHQLMEKKYGSPSEFVKKKGLNRGRNMQSLAKIAQFICSRKPLELEQISGNIGLEVMLVIEQPGVQSKRVVRKASPKHSEFRDMVMDSLKGIDESSVTISYALARGKPTEVDDDQSLRTLLEKFGAVELEEREIRVTVNQLEITAVVFDLQHPYSTRDSVENFSLPLTLTSVTTDDQIRECLEGKMTFLKDSEVCFYGQHGMFRSIVDFWGHVKSSFHAVQEAALPAAPAPPIMAPTEAPAPAQPQPTAKITLDIEVRTPDPPELKQLSPELQLHLKSRNLVALAPALAEDGIERPSQLARCDFSTDGLPAVSQKLSGARQNARWEALREVKGEAEAEEEAKLHEKAMVKYRRKMCQADECSKKWDEFISQAKQKQADAANKAKTNRANEANIVKETVNALMNDMRQLDLPSLDFSLCRDVASLEAKLTASSQQYVPPGHKTTSELVNGASMFNGLYLDPMTVKDGGKLFKLAMPVCWSKATTPDDLANIFKFGETATSVYTSELMTEKQYQKAWKHREQHSNSFGFHASLAGSAFMGSGVGSFSMSADISTAKEEISENEGAIGKKETTWCMLSVNSLPQTRIRIGPELLELSPMATRELLAVAKKIDSPEEDLSCIGWFNKWGTHVAVDVLLGIERVHIAKYAMNGEVTTSDCRSALASALSSSVSASASYSGIGGAGRAEAATDRHEENAQASAERQAGRAESSEVTVDKKFWAEQDSGLAFLSDDALAANASKSNGNWTVLARSFSEDSLVPLWEVAKQMQQFASHDKLLRSMERVFVQKVLQLEELWRIQMGSPQSEDFAHAENNINQFIAVNETCRSYLRGLHDTMKKRWSASKAEMCSNCGVLLSASKVEEHKMNDCIKRPVQCARAPNEEFYGCGEMVTQEALIGHKRDHCQHRPVACTGCHEQVMCNKMAWHELYECLQAEAPCPNQLCGCQERIRRGEIDRHVEICDFQQLRCVLCAERVLRKDMETHRATLCAERTEACDQCGEQVLQREMMRHKAQTCDYRTVRCGACNAEYVSKERDAHEAVCGGKSIACDLCNRTVRRQDLPGHKQTDCMSAPVDCQQCQARVTRSDLPTHRRRSCPMRAVLCEKCGGQTQFHVLEDHKRSQCPNRDVECHKCRKSIPFSRLEDHRQQHRKMVHRITVRKCKYIDKIIFEYFDGTKKSVGEHGGGDQVTFTLDEDEYITGLYCYMGAKLDSIQIDTNKRELPEVKGYGKGGGECSFHAESGHCITFLDRRGGESGRITALHETRIPR